MKTVRICLWEHRFRKGWTQAELARRAGLTQGYISQIEHGKAIPNLLVAERLATVLEIPIQNLLKKVSDEQ